MCISLCPASQRFTVPANHQSSKTSRGCTLEKKKKNHPDCQTEVGISSEDSSRRLPRDSAERSRNRCVKYDCAPSRHANQHASHTSLGAKLSDRNHAKINACHPRDSRLPTYTICQQYFRVNSTRIIHAVCVSRKFPDDDFNWRRCDDYNNIDRFTLRF